MPLCAVIPVEFDGAPAQPASHVVLRVGRPVFKAAVGQHDAWYRDYIVDST